jgi:hypothetical protein
VTVTVVTSLVTVSMVLAASLVTDGAYIKYFM